LVVRNNPLVEFVEEDQAVHLDQDSCTGDQANADWGLSRVCKRELELDGTYFWPTEAGQDVDAYIIDTGVYIQHNDFQGRAVFAYKSNNNWPDTDDNGHGTHVASIVGGARYGVAKRVTLVGVKVLDAGGSGSIAGIVSGIDYCIASKNRRGKPSVGNMSLGTTPVSQALNSAVNSASSAGVNMYVSAGNTNSDSCQRSPASAANACAVGSLDIGDMNGQQVDERSYFSCYGPCVCVFAPGSDILAAWIGSPTASRVLSGTSMAAPHACGVASLILSKNPSWTFDQVRTYIKEDATFGKINLQCTNQLCEQSPNLLLFNGCE